MQWTEIPCSFAIAVQISENPGRFFHRPPESGMVLSGAFVVSSSVGGLLLGDADEIDGLQRLLSDSSVPLEVGEVAVARGELGDVLDVAAVPGLVDVEVVGEEVDVLLSSPASKTAAILFLSSA